MGICSSRYAVLDAASPATAKLIHQDGRLQEFSYPAKVSYVLRLADPDSFICNSDDMDFDDVVSPVANDDVLQIGQLYFALPRSLLSCPLSPQEMGALAVKASAALMKAGCNEGGCLVTEHPVFFFGGKKDGEPRPAANRVVVGGKKAGRSNGRRSTGPRSGGGGARSRKEFTVNLSSIQE